MEKNINKSILPIINFETMIITFNKLYESIFSEFINNNNLPFTSFQIKLFFIKKYIGAFISSNYSKDIIDRFLIKIPFPKLLHCKLNKYICDDITNNKYNNVMYGWYNISSAIALEGSIIKYKPNIVCELGMYFGKSSCGIFQAANHINKKIKFYGCDMFTHCTNNITAVSNTPLDQKHFWHPKLDTTVYNLSRYHKDHEIHLFICDFIDLLKYFNDNNIKPDLVYIDCIKKLDILLQTIEILLLLNENMVIVGDDLNCCKHFIIPLQYKFKNKIKFFHPTAYIIYNDFKDDNFWIEKPISNFEDFNNITFTKKELKKIPNELKSFT